MAAGKNRVPAREKKAETSVSTELPQPRVLTDTITVAEAARMAGKHPQTIRRWANDGTLRSTRLGHREFRIYKDSLAAFLGGDGAADGAAPASDSSDRRPTGGLFDPDWGLFTRQPFGDLEGSR
jgi:excisionase family DNA binding protein